MILVRYLHLETVTVGRLKLDNGFECKTIEPPWRDNKLFVSCIPCGEYDLEYDLTGRVRNVPRLRNTHPRTQINLHAANYPTQLHGCIAPCMDVMIHENSYMGLRSVDAMDMIMETINTCGLVDGDSLKQALIIRDFKTE